MSRGLPIGDNKPCYRDCLIFLLRGEFIIKGQGRVIDTGCAYRVKDEAWIWLCGTTTIVVMEEGEQRGECLRCTQESWELILAQRDGPRKVRKRAKKLLDEKLQELVSLSRLHRFVMNDLHNALIYIIYARTKMFSCLRPRLRFRPSNTGPHG